MSERCRPIGPGPGFVNTCQHTDRDQHRAVLSTLSPSPRPGAQGGVSPAQLSPNQHRAVLSTLCSVSQHPGYTGAGRLYSHRCAHTRVVNTHRCAHTRVVNTPRYRQEGGLFSVTGRREAILTVVHIPGYLSPLCTYRVTSHRYGHAGRAILTVTGMQGGYSHRCAHTAGYTSPLCTYSGVYLRVWYMPCTYLRVRYSLPVHTSGWGIASLVHTERDTCLPGTH